MNIQYMQEIIDLINGFRHYAKNHNEARRPFDHNQLTEISVCPLVSIGAALRFLEEKKLVALCNQQLQDGSLIETAILTEYGKDLPEVDLLNLLFKDISIGELNAISKLN